MTRIVVFLLLVSFVRTGLGQVDTTKHGYPLTPFFTTHPITGVFGEFRNTLSSDHFHNGTDIPRPDGSPAYSVYDGSVTSIGTVSTQGENAFVRIRYNVGVNGQLKSDAYVHIAPNPLLNVGDSVYAHQTVLGNILTGLGHVHFTNGYVGGEMNAIRPNGGLTPYIDNYPPKILSVRFFIDETNTELVGNRVSGAVDIRAQIAETNAADPSELRSSTTNNGTYIAGYKILSADSSTVVYEPPSAGVRYRFDAKPNDAYVARVYAPGSDVATHIYTITNGDGADYISSTHIVNTNSWNTLALPAGNYVAMVFAQDTRSLADTVYVPVQVTRADLVAPALPVLQSVLNDSTNRITVRWYPNTDPDLRGYRLYFTLDGSNWTLKDNESVLGRDRTSISYNNVLSGRIFFRLAAVDSAAPANVSTFSDVYGVRLNSSATKTLLVDGFDRTEASGSYHEASHPFAMTHGFSLPTDFSTCSNEAVIQGAVSLQSYQVVVWMLGDESTHDKTFDSNEQTLVKAFLQSGGKLFVNGSEIAWDLDRPSGPTDTDRDFLHTYLKARYVGDNANEYSVTGATSSVFQDVHLRYGVVVEGSPYAEDWPDYIEPEGGSTVVLHYGTAGNPVYAGVGYKGLFPNGSQPGGVAYVGFPFETITTRADRDSLMRRVYQFFDILTTVSGPASVADVPTRYQLLQNYPNPFNPATVVSYQLPVVSAVKLVVFDVLGREVAVLVNERKEQGRYTVRFDGTGLASGVYLYRLEATALTTSDEQQFTQMKKLVIVK